MAGPCKQGLDDPDLPRTRAHVSGNTDRRWTRTGPTCAKCETTQTTTVRAETARADAASTWAAWSSSEPRTLVSTVSVNQATCSEATWGARTVVSMEISQRAASAAEVAQRGERPRGEGSRGSPACLAWVPAGLAKWSAKRPLQMHRTARRQAHKLAALGRPSPSVHTAMASGRRSRPLSQEVCRPWHLVKARHRMPAWKKWFRRTHWTTPEKKEGGAVRLETARLHSTSQHSPTHSLRSGLAVQLFLQPGRHRAAHSSA